MPKFLMKYGFVIFCFVALTASVISYGMTGAEISDETETRAQEIQTLEQSYIAREQQLREESQQVYDDLLGTDYSRVQRDSEVIEQLLDTALTWDDNDSYVSARNAVIDEYDLSQDSHFLQTYLPEAPVNTDAAGNEYPYIDAAGLNSQLGDFEAEVLSVIRTDYRYLVSVSAESTSNDAEGSAQNSSVVLVTINGEGQVSDISGYAEDAEFPRRESGSGFGSNDQPAGESGS